MIWLQLAKKELRDVLRERTILVALVVQFFIAAFSTLLLFGLTGLYDPGSITEASGDVGYVGPGDAADYIRSHGISATIMDVDEGFAAFEEGRIDALVLEEVGSRHNITILLGDGELRTPLLMGVLKAALEEMEQDLRLDAGAELNVVMPDLPEVPSTKPYVFAYTTLLPLLVLTPIFLSGAVAGDSFETEVQTRTLLLLRSSPLTPAGILAGKLLVPLLIAPAQVALWMGLFWLNNLSVVWPWVLVITAVLTLLLASVGILVSVRAGRGQTQEIYALVVLVLMALSLYLPRNPLNLVGLAATGTFDAASATSLAIMAAAAGGLFVAAAWAARRALQADKL